ncbi:MAG: carboxypeptidase regulatory-like domain-containing protein [Thermoguttaceae bacterium]
MKRNCFLNCRLECMIPVVVLLSTLSVARPLSAAGSGVRGQVLALDEQGKLTGIVAGATIELTNQAGQVAGRATSDAQVGKSGDDVTAEAPLAEATVWISKPDGSGKVRGVTGSNGQAGLNVPAGPGDYIAGAELRGYRPVRANVTIGSAGVTTHKFLMTRAGLVLDVIVVDDRKQPLVGASVELRRQENGGLTQGRTAAGGRVRLNVTAGPGNYELSAQLNGYKPGRRTVAISEGGHGRETIVLEKQQTAQPKLTVIVSGQNAGGATTLLSGAAVQISRNNHPMKAGRTDSRGRFTLNLAPGDYQVRVSSPGYAPANFAKVTVGPDGREEKIVLHANIQ